jgi:hypothetical protein
MRRYIAYVVGGLCFTVTMVVYVQQGPREAAPAAALDAAPVAYSLQLSVTGLPRRGESL